MVVDDDAVLHGEARGLRQRVVGHGAGADHDEIGRERVAGLGLDREPPSGSSRSARGAVPTRISTPRARWRSWMMAEVSSSQTRARMRGAISITVVFTPSSAADAAISSPTTPPPIRMSDLAAIEMRLERARLGLGAQVVDAVAAGRKHRQHAVDRAGGEHQRVIGDALARFGHHRARGAIDRRDARAALERDADAGDALRPGDRRVLRRAPCR